MTAMMLRPRLARSARPLATTALSSSSRTLPTHSHSLSSAATLTHCSMHTASSSLRLSSITRNTSATSLRLTATSQLTHTLPRTHIAAALTARYASTTTTAGRPQSADDGLWESGTYSSHTATSSYDTNRALQDTQHVAHDAAGQAVPSQLDPTSALDFVDDRWRSTKFITSYIESAFEMIHDTTGLPWWATIAICTVGVRLLVFPLAIQQVKTGAAMKEATEKTRPIREWLDAKKASPDGVSPSDQKQAALMMQKVFKDMKINPLKMFAPVVALAPTFIFIFLTLRHMTHTHPSMVTEGALWFTDLTALDPYFGLPALSAATTVLALHWGAGDTPQVDASSDTAKKVRYGFSAMAIIGSAVMAYQVPAAVFLYWTVNNLITFLQGRLFRMKATKRLLRIPEDYQPAPLGQMSNPAVAAAVPRAAAKPIQATWQNAEATASSATVAAASSSAASEQPVKLFSQRPKTVAKQKIKSAYQPPTINISKSQQKKHYATLATPVQRHVF